ncbi:addiction module antidote protein [Paucibacter sp. B51]|uniref:addiction module antidote protein n=1 Tax=Paucibacter sp. B51 TaxID=2993315 RepID=UPI0022EC14A6|nr:addiction module antidote protein [Paucibacter sp. B51]
MGKKCSKAVELTPFYAAEYLADEKAIAAYLTKVIAEGDAGALAQALGTVARAHGMSAIAESSGVGRESLYKALRPGSAPRFETVQRVCAALGVRLIAVPEHSRAT